MSEAMKRRKLNKFRPELCHLCRSALEPADGGWICPSCMIIWCGDTFKPLEKDTPDLPPSLDFRFGM